VEGPLDRETLLGIPGPTGYRDVACGRVDGDWVGKTVRLAGWVHRRRDQGGVKFLLLRDRTGLVQLAFEPERTPTDVLAAAGDVSPEDVLWVTGDVEARPPEAVNPDMPTGQVEVRVRKMQVLASSDPLPILVAIPPGEELPSEELRLRHRVLDLRRPEMQSHFVVRHLATNAARASLARQGFLEVETPFLTRRTPEGARDYLVPSRIHHGEFYALPQSPQLYKQLLMVAGFDRYFQIARCLRDEDLRADRQPEFTQIDVEMAFVDEDDVFAACERMLVDMYELTLEQVVEAPFRRMTWSEAEEVYGTDKPDLRIEWKIRDYSSVLGGRGFGIFDGAISAGGRVRGIVIPGGTSLSRSRLDAANETARSAGARGALWLKCTEDGYSGPAARAVDEEAASILRNDYAVSTGDLVVFVAGPDSESSPALDVLRRTLASEMGAVGDHDEWLWVTDFPLFEADPETGAPTATHHPFTMPVDVTPEQIARRSVLRALAGLRPGSERNGARQRQYPVPRPSSSESHSRGSRHVAGAGGRPLRVPAGGLSVRRSAARRVCSGARPVDCAHGGCIVAARRDRVPEDDGRSRTHGGSSGQRRQRAACRSRHPSGRRESGSE